MKNELILRKYESLVRKQFEREINMHDVKLHIKSINQHNSDGISLPASFFPSWNRHFTFEKAKCNLHTHISAEKCMRFVINMWYA